MPPSAVRCPEAAGRQGRIGRKKNFFICLMLQISLLKIFSEFFFIIL